MLTCRFTGFAGALAVAACCWMTFAASMARAQEPQPQGEIVPVQVQAGQVVYKMQGPFSFIERIKKDVNSFTGKLVEVTGTLGDTQQGYEAVVEFRDRYGQVIDLKIKQGDVATNGTIWAIVDVSGGRPMLVSPRLPGSGPIVEPPTWWQQYGPWVLLGAAAVLLLVVAVLIVKMLRPQAQPVAPAPFPTAQPAPTPLGAPVPATGPIGLPVSTDMSATIKRTIPGTMLSTTRESTVATPTDSTMKLLPGSFDVLSGTGKGQRIFIYFAETTIGRGHREGRGVGHIGFDPEERSISRDQAKLLYDGVAKRFRLQNLSDPTKVNATVVNGREMGLNELTELSDTDIVRFGEIELQFRATDRVPAQAGRAEAARA